MVSLLFFTNEHPRVADYKPVSTEKYHDALRGELAPLYMGHGNFSSCTYGSLYALADSPAVARSSHLLSSSEEGWDIPHEQYGGKRALEAGRLNLEIQNRHCKSS